MDILQKTRMLIVFYNGYILQVKFYRTDTRHAHKAEWVACDKGYQKSYISVSDSI